MTKPVQVGSEIKYRCPKCDLDLWHTVLAMMGREPARIRCNTCKSERNYRAPRTMKTASAQANSVRRNVPAPELYQQKLQAALMKTPIAYRMDIKVEVGDVVDHKSFGRGIVLKTIPPDRMEIIFQDETKVLACKLA